MTTVVVLPEAENDLLEAQIWLTENASREVALRLGTEFQAITARIAEQP